MRTPSYTDLHRYPVPYVRAEHTDISKTFARIREWMRATGVKQTTVRLRVIK